MLLGASRQLLRVELGGQRPHVGDVTDVEVREDVLGEAVERDPLNRLDTERVLLEESAIQCRQKQVRRLPGVVVREHARRDALVDRLDEKVRQRLVVAGHRLLNHGLSNGVGLQFVHREVQRPYLRHRRVAGDQRDKRGQSVLGCPVLNGRQHIAKLLAVELDERRQQVVFRLVVIVDQ